MDLNHFLFIVIAAFTGLSAVAVVVTQNIVRAAVWLLFTLAGTAGVFFLLGSDFVAATQLIVYIGGILVLVVFGVMLTAQGPFVTMRVGPAEWAIAMVVGLLLFSVLVVGILGTNWTVVAEEPPRDPQTSTSSAVLGEAFLGLTDATPRANVTGLPKNLVNIPARKQIAYLLPFEIVSVHLLVVLIGAAYLARAKRRKGTVA